MLTKQFTFDSEGRISESTCKDCAVQMHRADGRLSADVVEKYYYENNRILKIERKDFEESTDQFYYSSSGDKRLKVTTDKNGERIALELSDLDKEGQEILTYNIDFDVPYPSGDSVSQIFIDKSLTDYQSNKVIRQTFRSDELVNMGRTIHVSTFKIFKSSFTPIEVENALASLHKNFLKLWSIEVTKSDTNKIQTKDKRTNKVKATYHKDSKGLITNSEEEYGDGTKELVYKYQYVD